MDPDVDSPAELKFTGDPVHPPADWSGAQEFRTLRAAHEAAVEHVDRGPWVRCGAETLKPTDIDDLWKRAFRPLSD